MNSEQSNDSFVECRCPYCGSALAFPEAHRSTAQECPHCSEVVVVPSDASEICGRLPLPIQTPRLNLRPLMPEDLPAWLEFMKDEDSYKYLPNYPPDEERGREWLQRTKVFKLVHPEGYLALGIELKSESKIIGSLTFQLNDPEEHRQGSFHLMMHPVYRCRGYGVEAVLGLFGLAFNVIGLHDVRVRIDMRNLAGRRMVEKAGMRLEGEFFEQTRVKGEWESSAYYVMFSTWWSGVTHPSE